MLSPTPLFWNDGNNQVTDNNNNNNNNNQVTNEFFMHWDSVLSAQDHACRGFYSHSGVSPKESTQVWRHPKNISLEFPDFRLTLTTSRKYSRKYELWWKFDENWLNDGWDMTRWICKYCHTFSIICVHVRTERKITKNVLVEICHRSTAHILGNFCSIFVNFFRHNLCFGKFFLNISRKVCNV